MPNPHATPSRIRYGDYFGAARDPVDGSVWAVGEYVRAGNEWASRLGRVEV